MKTILQIALIFLSLNCIAQIPTNGLQRAYDFTNGNLTDAANSNNFLQNGTSLLNVDDRFSTVNNSISLNGDYLSSSNFGFTNLTISFWIRTDINDGNERTIFDKSTRSGANFSINGPGSGFFIFLKNGKIGVKTSRRVVANNNTGAQGYAISNLQFSEFIANDSWRHVTITVKKEATQFNTSSGRNTYPFTYNYYVDDVLEQTRVENVQVGGIFTSQGINTAANFTVGNNNSGSLTAINQFNQTVDDIYIYNRVLSASEVTQITTDNNYTVCETPDIADFSTSNITENTATLVLPQTNTFDVAYGLSSQPFNTHTIINDVNGNVNLTSLILSSEYTVRYRKKCTGNTTYSLASGWSLPETFRTKGPLFVKANATGLNDGSSWANAFTSLQDALANVNANEEIWVAAGTYKASTTDRTQSFIVNDDDLKLYGGFAGTETSIAQRDVVNNETILSGDLMSNDNAVIDFGESTRSDNTQHIIRLNAQNTSIDGFTISDGHTIGASNESGAAIFVTVSNPLGFTVNNCIIKNNVADNGAFFRFSSLGAYSSGTRNVNITNTIVENNLSRIGTIYLRDANAEDTNVTLYNCLFKDNVVKDRTGGPAGFAGSVVWAVSNSIPSRLTITLNIINTTAVNNEDLGTNGGLNNFTRSPIVFGESSSTMVTDISNTIVWNNTTTNGNTSRAVSAGNNTSTGTVSISNSISNDDFSNIAAGSKVNTSNTDPLFTSTTDFTLQTTSPAKDFGDNSKLPAPLNIDLAGNSRIFNVAVDLGAYEFGATTFRPILNILATNGTVTTNPNPTNGAYDFLETVSLTAVPNAGFEFTGWSGDLSGNAASEQLLMDSNKALTATFAPIQRTLTINSVGGTITTNPNPVNGTYDNGTVVTITVTPNIGFMFDGWSGDATGNANPLMITMDGDKVITAEYLKNRVFVDQNATGANDGSSWADAYTSLQNALDNNPISDFWIKAGTYVPGTVSSDIFTLLENQALYGGFNGTETMLSQRDPSMNVTILSGDLLGNDDGNLVFGNVTYSDNSTRILQILQDGAIVDGLTISGGNADGGNSSLKSGAGIRIIESCKKATFNNVIFTDNRVESAGVVFYQHVASQTGNYDYEFSNCEFKNNLGRFSTAFYGVNPRTNGTLTTTFTNCSFHDNVAANLSNTDTGRNAILWFRTDVATTHNGILTNCTITNNSLNGTSASSVGVISASRVGGTCNLEINNTIVWDNKLSNGNEQTSVRQWETQTVPNTVTIANSLAPDGFSNWTNTSNIVTTDPMFNDPTTEDYTLIVGSPAIDTGDNTFVTQSEDLAGNNRIINGTVDLGAYEFGNSSTTYVWNGVSWNISPEGNITASDNMIIQSGATASLNTAITVGNLTIENGAILDINAGDVTINNDLINNGIITGTNSSIMNGSSLQTISGIGSIQNLSIDNINNVTITSSQDLLGTLEVITGNLSMNGNLTFKSDATSTAVIAPLGNGASITGNVKVERYIPASNRSFRFLASSVTGESIFDSWQESAVNVSGFGIQVTGTPGTAGVNDVTTGLDQTSTGNPSMFTWDEVLQSWNSINNTKTEILTTGSFYRTFVRGDRTTDLTTNTPSITATTLRATGLLTTGTVAINPTVGASEFFAVSNPYQSKLNLGTTTSSNIGTDMYYWDPTVGPNGTYSTINVTSGNVGTSGFATNILEPGQAVFFTATGTASVIINESDKVSGVSNVDVFSTPSAQQFLRIKLYQTLRFQNNQTESDGLYIQFDSQFSDALNFNDAYKWDGLNANIAIKKGNDRLSVERRTLPLLDEIVPLDITNYIVNDYTMAINLDILPGRNVFIKDNFTGVQTPVNQGIQTLVNFNVDPNNQMSIAPNRFEIVFQNVTLSADDHTSLENTIRLYPNPVVDGILNIDTAGIEMEESVIRIYNTIGQQVVTKKVEVNTGGIIRITNLHELSDGVYIIKLTIGDRSVIQRFIKK